MDVPGAAVSAGDGVHLRCRRLLEATELQLRMLEGCDASAAIDASLQHAADRAASGDPVVAALIAEAERARTYSERVAATHARLREAALAKLPGIGGSEDALHAALAAELLRQRNDHAGDNAHAAAAAERERLALAVAAVLDSCRKDAERAAQTSEAKAIVGTAFAASQPGLGGAGGRGHAAAAGADGSTDVSTQTTTSVTQALAATRAVTSGRVRKDDAAAAAAVAAKRPRDADHARTHAHDPPPSPLATTRAAARGLLLEPSGSRRVQARRCRVTATAEALTITATEVAQVLGAPCPFSSGGDAAAPATTSVAYRWHRVADVILGFGHEEWHTALAFAKKIAAMASPSGGAAESGARTARLFPGFFAELDAEARKAALAAAQDATIGSAGASPETNWLRAWPAWLQPSFDVLSCLGARAITIVCVEDAEDDPIHTALEARQSGKPPVEKKPRHVAWHFVAEEQAAFDELLAALGYFATCCGRPRRVGQAELKAPLTSPQLPLGDQIVFRSLQDAHLASIALPKLDEDDVALCTRLRVSPMHLLSLRKRLFSPFARSVIAVQDLLVVADVSPWALREIIDVWAARGLLRLHTVLRSSGPS